jgi:hypothetical protein
LRVICLKENDTGKQNPIERIFKELAQSLNSLSSQLDSMIDFSANIEYKSPELLKMAFYVIFISYSTNFSFKVKHYTKMC